jgi:hypothetical protein
MKLIFVVLVVSALLVTAQGFSLTSYIRLQHKFARGDIPENNQIVSGTRFVGFRYISHETTLIFRMQPLCLLEVMIHNCHILLNRYVIVTAFSVRKRSLSRAKAYFHFYSVSHGAILMK